MKVLIDCDPGIDDAIALGMVLSRQDIEIVGITCVRGNVEVQQCVKNTLKILEVYDRKDVPVFQGAASAIIGHEMYAKHFHGEDGMGDVLHYEPDRTPFKEEHAVIAMTRLARQFKGELTLIAIGPLTNLALALRMDPTFGNNPKDLIVMGGNYKGVGNVTIAAEFNFYMDPISAQIVLEEFKIPTYLVTWELSKQLYLNLDDISQYCSQDNKKSKFKRKILDAANLLDTPTGYCDAVCVAIATNREIVTKEYKVYGTVEIEGAHTKGMVVFDWNPQDLIVGEAKEPNLIVVDEINAELFQQLFIESIK